MIPSEHLTTSPQDKLVKIAKKLKKNNVAVDIVSFGAEEENQEKLEAFHQAVNSNGNSNFVSVPPGPVLSDVLIGSPIFQGEGGAAYGFGGGGGGGGAAGAGAEGFEFGVDPNMDPELALALRCGRTGLSRCVCCAADTGVDQVFVLVGERWCGQRCVGALMQGMRRRTNQLMHASLRILCAREASWAACQGSRTCMQLYGPGFWDMPRMLWVGRSCGCRTITHLFAIPGPHTPLRL